MKDASSKCSTGLNRRTFLKASGIAALGAATDSGALASNDLDSRLTDQEGGKSPAQKRLVDSVNVLQGTDSTKVFSRGNTLPIAALPFGMAHWTIQSRSDSPWMFHPADRRIQGFRLTHQLSPWLGDYGYATF